MHEETVETDVLCVGGGIAGLMAAIRASEIGARVVVAEKANSIRSGAGGMGNDHFACYIPDIHGPDIKPAIEGFRHSLGNGWHDIDYIESWLEKSFVTVQLWESWGIPMKSEGRYEFAGHGVPGKPLQALKYSGQNQKRILTSEVLKRGVQIMNRVMVFELLRSGQGIIGALGVDTRAERLIKFQARSIILGTGQCMRLYPSPTPGWMFNISNPPSDTGDGRAMAYRAGAELVLLEMPMPWAGPKYFARCGKGTWVGLFRDPHGKAIGSILAKPDKKYGDITADLYPAIFEDYAKLGRGPVYMDCGGISDKDFDYMIHYLKQEGNIALLNHLAEEGIDVREHPVEFTTYERAPRGGVSYNRKGETSVEGLYAAGDEIFGGISNAATFGWIAGENAAMHAKEVPPSDMRKASDAIEEKESLLAEFRSRKIGASWKEVNIALQQIMQDYAGAVRSETMLNAGLSYLRRLKQNVFKTMKAENQHELMHCLEVINLLDVGELVFVAAIERRETRGTHFRPDHPFANPLMDQLLVVKMVNGETTTRWREIKR